MKKQVLALILVAAVIGAVAVYVFFRNPVGPSVALGVFSVDSAGKILVTSGGEVTLEVLPDAFPNKTDITIYSIQNPTLDGYLVVSVFQCEPKGTSFRKPATLQLKYNPEDLPSDLKESDLRLFMQLPSAIAELPNSQIDLVNHTVSGQISHFTKFFLGKHKPTTNEKPDPAIIGKWRITSSDPPSIADDVYTIFAGGDARDFHLGNWDTGSWSGSGSSFVWNWNFGPSSGFFVDTVHVEPDGNHITYQNQYGYKMTGVRVTDNKPPSAKIELPRAPNKVETELTLRSASTDPDDPVGMLKYSWTVTSPYGEILETSTPWLQETTFTPHKIGEYVISLKVDDGISIDSATTILRVIPNIKIDVWEVYYGSIIETDSTGMQYQMNVVAVSANVTNFGSEKVWVSPYVWYQARLSTGKEFYVGKFPLLGYVRSGYNKAFEPPWTIVGNDDYENLVGYVNPDHEPNTLFGTLTDMPWNALLEVFNYDTQETVMTLCYSDYLWADVFHVDAAKDIPVPEQILEPPSL